ncbi:hypothetical protein LDK17_05065 [Fusobacterium polymorphum]|uniref:hypothetical protein n=1 Tax=Fusobacterium nucleatum subsp. polymorphum TaxID=76857 RepID=UPI0030D26B93
MKKNFIYLCLIVIIVLIACSGKEDDKKETIQNKEEKTIIIAEKAEIKTLDPQKTVDSASLSVIQMINQKLFKIDNDGNIIPEIAEEVTNVVFYQNQDFDNLISKARETIDKEKRIDLYKKAQDIIQEELPHYAILYSMQNFVYKKNIKGIEVNKRGYFNFQNTIVE